MRNEELVFFSTVSRLESVGSYTTRVLCGWRWVVLRNEEWIENSFYLQIYK